MDLLRFEGGVHLVRYGISADQRYLAGEFLDAYDATVINGNMVAHIPAALGQFLADRTSRETGPKPFIIDPLTHAFQHDPSKVRTKRKRHGEEVEETKLSIAKMSEAFGEPVQSYAGKQAVLPSDFEDEGRSREFCRRVVDFQLNRIESEAQQQKSWKYLRYLGVQNMKPAVVIAPYFWMTAGTVEEWLPRNIWFVECARNFAGTVPLCAQVVVTRDVLVDDAERDKLAEEYGSSPCDGILLWIDQFPEHEVSAKHLLGFGRLVGKLSRTFKKPVINLYGGYFSILLSRLPELATLQGVCHGLEYGEDRSVVPVGSGLPMAKFYLPAHHRRLRYRQAVRAVRDIFGGFESVEAYHSRICACAECQSVVRSRPAEDFAAYGRSRPITFQRQGGVVTLDYPTEETKDHCLRHYLHVKRTEFEEAHSLDSRAVAAELTERHKLAARLMGDEAYYLKAWAAAVTQLASAA
jgi:hypothetical protein